MFTQPLSRPGREGFQRYSAEDVYVQTAGISSMGLFQICYLVGLILWYLWRFSQHHLGRRGPERYGGGGAVRRRRWVVNNNKITSEERGSSSHSTSPGWRPPAHLGWHWPARRSPGGWRRWGPLWKRRGGVCEFLKTLRGCSEKVKARCLQIICLFLSRFWFLPSQLANVIRATRRNMLSAKF